MVLNIAIYTNETDGYKDYSYSSNIFNLTLLFFSTVFFPFSFPDVSLKKKAARLWKKPAQVNII